MEEKYWQKQFFKRPYSNENKLRLVGGENEMEILILERFCSQFCNIETKQCRLILYLSMAPLNFHFASTFSFRKIK